MSARTPGRIRIVAGSRRGRLIRVPKGRGTRPTAEKVREAVFNALGSVTGLRALDLFAGTGAMGLEALSRGARECVFVEEDPVVAKILSENVASLGFIAESRVINTGYQQALTNLISAGSGFDLLFIDPPYRMLAEAEAVVTPLLSSLLSVEGLTVIEGDRAARVGFGGEPVFDRIYGDTRVVMVRMRRGDR
ncbi:MAG: 16S rRNA (guanine(966)-N(2))-methyltransferase RsmD [Actinobacteria bacterium]|nr:16S rRNA (guanine(966)-N(2))-methyltransferase RsmD [Actinomycetota bacterium]